MSVHAWFVSRGTLQHEVDAFESASGTATVIDWATAVLPVDAMAIPGGLPDITRWMLQPAFFSFQMTFMEELERLGSKVVNRPASVLSCDKATIYLTWRRFLSDQVDFPPSVFTSDPLAFEEFCRAKDKVVLKPVDGQGSAGVKVIDITSAREAISTFNASVIEHGPLVVQQHVAGPGIEVRIGVAGNEIICCFVRTNDGGLHGVRHGGRMRPLEGSRVHVDGCVLDQIKEVALKVLELTGLDIAAVDFLMDSTGRPWLLEWNPFFAYIAAGSSLARDVAAKVARHVLALAKA